jgi:putative FmdB family regulatory protein
MPTYDYRCAKCGDDLEVSQSFSEAPLTKHDACGGKLTKVFSPVGIVLKGSGFYKTDNRSAAGRAKAKEDAGASTSDSSTSSGSSDSSASDSGKSDSAKSDSGSSGDSAKPKAAEKSNGAKSSGSKSNGSSKTSEKKSPVKSG